MIKNIIKAIKLRTRSLRAGMLVSIIVSLVLGLLFMLVSRTLINNWVDNEYNSAEAQSERYENYFGDLQTFISNNEISSENTSQLHDWMSSHRNVYLFLYKHEQMLFDGSLESILGNKDNTSKDENNESNESSDSSDGSTNDKEEDSSGSGDSSGSNGSITLDFPTREEIIEAAEKNGYRPIEFADDTLFVSFADFTDYLYYDLANIVSIVGGVLIIVIVLMLYFQIIIIKISRLAKDVSKVYEVDMKTPIRTSVGCDEFSVLTRNIEQMRSTMVDSLEKEKEAIEANTELITSMSHDIRTPLTVLLGYLDIMKSSTSDEVLMEYIKASESTALRLKDLSDDMFRYFLVFGDSRENVEISDYDANTLIQQLLTEHILLLREKGYSVRMQIGSSIKDGLRVLTDAPRAMRVFDNLFSNIHKYAEIEKNITVAAGVSHGKLTVAIKNYVASNSEGKESNKIGLKTCEKICESLGMRFEYYTSGVLNQKTFTARVEFAIAKEEKKDDVC